MKIAVLLTSLSLMLLPNMSVAQTKKQCIAAARAELNAAKHAAREAFQATKAECQASGGGGSDGLGCCLYTAGTGVGCAINLTAQQCAQPGDLPFPGGTFIPFGGSAADPSNALYQYCCVAPAGSDKGNCNPCQ